MQLVSDVDLPDHLKHLSDNLVATTDDNQAFWLAYSQGCLSLCQPGKVLPISVDFVSGKARHRRLQGGGKSQAVAKACGLAQRKNLHILDATAGMGGDGFVLASIGAEVTSLERNPVVYSLLKDGFARMAGCGEPDLMAISSRWHLRHEAALDHMINGASYDVVYLDPMFPARKKEKAAVGKEMVAFHSIVGADTDADHLLEPALACAKFRVVVKRPKIAPVLMGKQPDLQLVGKSSRFDIYTKAKIVAG